MAASSHVVVNDDDLFRAWKERPCAETRMALLRPQQDSVYNLCWQVLRHTHDAEDAAQKVFCELLPVLPTLASADGLRAWLYRASLLTALNLKRSTKRRMTHERTPRPPASPTLSDADVEAVHEHLANLRDDLRALVVRHYFERRTLEDLAQSDGCSSVAIWKRLQKAHEALRHSLLRAGLASLALSVVAFLETREAVAAPADLLSTALRGAPARTAAASSTATLATALLLVGLAGVVLLTVGAQRRRGEVHSDVAQTARNSAATPTAAAARVVSAAPSSSAPEPADDAVQTFRSGKAFWAAFNRAVDLRDDARRWRGFRRLGIRRSDQDLARAWANARAWTIEREWPFKVMQKVLEDWLLSDPPAVAAFVLGMPLDFTTDFSLVQTLGPAAQAWGETNPDAAVAFLKAIPRTHAVSELARGIELRARHRSDPDAFVTWMKALPTNDYDLYEATSIAFVDWAARDSRGAAAWIDRQHAPLRESTLRSIETAWASTGPWNQKCVEALDAAKDVALAVKTLSEQFLMGVAELDPTWEPEKAALWESLVFHPLVLSAIGRRSEENPAGMARIVETLPFDSWTLEAVDAVAKAWARSDPTAALDWLKRQPFKSIHEREISAVIGRWAISDPAAALRATEMLSEPLRIMAASSVVEVWVQTDPVTAGQVALSLPTPASDHLLGRLAGNMARQDVDAALAWTRGLPSLQARDVAYGCIAIGIIDDPEKALAIANQLTNAEHRGDTINRIITNTADGDPKAAVELLKKYPESYEYTYQEIARQFAFLDPLGGMAWAATLAEPERLDLLRSIILQGGYRRDLEPVRQWVEQSSLPQASKDELLKLIRRSKKRR